MMQPHDEKLAALRSRGRLRALAPRAGADFTSNDYLALAESALLRDAAATALARGVAVGAGGSRLLRGNHPEHEALEEEAAAFFGSETALYFPTASPPMRRWPRPCRTAGTSSSTTRSSMPVCATGWTPRASPPWKHRTMT